MKKRILSLICCVMMFMTSLVFIGCSGGSDPGQPNGPGDSGSGGTGGVQPPADTVSTVYDMRVVTVEFENTETFDPYSATLIALPDEKYMMVDPYLDSDYISDLWMQYLYFSNNKANSDGKSIIDYLVVTNPQRVRGIDDWFFEYFEVKNFYRPNFEQDVDDWLYALDISGTPETEEISYYGSGPTGIKYGDLRQIDAKHLTGHKRVAWEVEAHDATYTNYYYTYSCNLEYLLALYRMQKNGVNIIQTTNDADITNTFRCGGVDYDYTIDFYVPEPNIDLKGAIMDTIFEYYAETEGGKPYWHKSKTKTYLTGKYNQTAEIKTIISINYGDFDLLYLDSPTYNVFDSFLKNKDKNKKYDMLVGTYENDFDIKNQYRTWPLLIDAYLAEDVYMPSLMFDAAKVDTNCFFLIMDDSETSGHWYGTGHGNPWTVNDLYEYYYEDQIVIKKENTFTARTYRDQDYQLNIIMPILRAQKNGTHSVEVVTEDYPDSYLRALLPTVDGVYIQINII